MSQVKIPDVNSVADGGQLYFASVGEIVLIGLQEGGLSIAPPVWMRAHYLQAFGMIGRFIEQCSMKQAEDMQKMIQQALKHN